MSPGVCFPSRPGSTAFCAALLACAALALAACRAPRTPARCPEASALGCLTEPVCVVDPARDCQQCRCAVPPYVPPERTPPGPVLPR